MDSLQDLLKNKQPTEPPQLKALRTYVKEHYNSDVKVGISTMGYTVVVPDAPLATLLRMDMPKIQSHCNLDKKLFIRIGHF